MDLILWWGYDLRIYCLCKFVNVCEYWSFWGFFPVRQYLDSRVSEIAAIVFVKYCNCFGGKQNSYYFTQLLNSPRIRRYKLIGFFLVNVKMYALFTEMYQLVNKTCTFFNTNNCSYFTKIAQSLTQLPKIQPNLKQCNKWLESLNMDC